MKRRILFVDDDSVQEIVVEQQLRGFSEHFDLVFARDGLDAIKKMETTYFSLVCIDLNMPRMNGASLFAHIRGNFPHIPVIIMSPMKKEEMENMLPPEGIVDYFTKPLGLELLGKRISNYLQRQAKGGTMNNVSPPVFFQFMEMEAKTCTARVLDNGSRRGGILYFRDGELFGVRHGGTTGLDAAHEIFSWNDVTVFIENECPEMDNSINLPLQTIIMQAVSMKDEDEEVLELQGLEEGHANDSAGYSRIKNMPFADLKAKLGSEIADQQTYEMVEKPELAHGVEAIQKLGAIAALGEFTCGSALKNDGEAVVILNRRPPVEVQCSGAEVADKIIRTLS